MLDFEFIPFPIPMPVLYLIIDDRSPLESRRVEAAHENRPLPRASGFG